MKPLISVLMPTFNQAMFIRRALNSLQNQNYKEWELIVVDDGSTDNTQDLVKPYLIDKRIQYYRIKENKGLGAALNVAFEKATGTYISYLPSDDIYYREHLQSLVELLEHDENAVLAFSGIKYEHRLPGQGNKEILTSKGQIESFPLQLVQVMHKKTDKRWMEREELVTDDLERMFWNRLRDSGDFIRTEQVTCEWVDHPLQRHKIIQDPDGGINPYRIYYNVKQPLKFHSTRGDFIDEVTHYKQFRERPDTPTAKDGLKILLVGELGFNPERVLAFEERGHKLYGLWTDNIVWFNGVGPVPFGHVEDVPRDNWKEAIAKIKPDVIFAMLNQYSVPLAYEVLKANTGVPFIWHFKEGPLRCIANGTFQQLLDLYTYSDGQVYCNPEVQAWFQAVSPDIPQDLTYILFGDLAKKEWFHTSERTPLLSDTDGEVHTVIPGQPSGFDAKLIGELASYGIHVHFYGDFFQKRYEKWLNESKAVAPNHLHLHPSVSQRDWVAELSKYDAGWLHVNRSENNGDIHRASWTDLNHPARITTLAAAGLPFILYDNAGQINAPDALARTLDIGVFYKDIPELSKRLHDKEAMKRVRENIWNVREQFTFDYYADTLIEFFRKAIEKKNKEIKK